MAGAYKGITYCNIALENIPGIDMDELEKNASWRKLGSSGRSGTSTW